MPWFQSILLSTERRRLAVKRLRSFPVSARCRYISERSNDRSRHYSEWGRRFNGGKRRSVPTVPRRHKAVRSLQVALPRLNLVLFCDFGLHTDNDLSSFSDSNHLRYGSYVVQRFCLVGRGDANAARFDYPRGADRRAAIFDNDGRNVRKRLGGRCV